MSHRPPWRRFSHVLGLAVLSAIATGTAVMPIIPLVMHITGPVRYAYARHVPLDADSVFLTTAQGELELYPWYSPQTSFPSDVPHMPAGAIRDFFVSRPALDLPSRFSVINLKTKIVTPFRAVKLPNGRQMRLIPVRALKPGRYLFLAPNSGMDVDNVWYYFSIVPGRSAPA